MRNNLALDFKQEAIDIANKAREKGINLRILGALAVRIHCPKLEALADTMKREITDIDLVTYSEDKGKLDPFFLELAYVPDERFNLFHGEKRHIYNSTHGSLHLDVFFDRLDMCHTLDLRARVEMDFPTITVSDILLEKMQIVKLNEKDVKDAVVLLLDHDISNNDKESVNVEYVSSLLSKEWGFYYTVTTNLRKVQNLAKNYDSLSDRDKLSVDGKIDSVLSAIDRAPKSLSWKARARIGPKKKWYKDVEEVAR